MQKGVVKWFNYKKGWGFIDCEGQDIFVHYKDIQMPGFKSLDAGQVVNFKVVTGENGLKAIFVRQGNGDGAV